MAGKRRSRGAKKPPKFSAGDFFVPSVIREQKETVADRNTGGTKFSPDDVYVPPDLPDTVRWSGNAKRMPPGYVSSRTWRCPSCDVNPGQNHERWCPRYLFEKNLYDRTAYADPDFLSRAGFDMQIFWGPGHPPISGKTFEAAREFWAGLGVDVSLPQGEIPF